MKALITLLLAALLATGCASRREPASQTYDFGIAAPPAGASADSVFVAEVRAADWLDSTDMFYRLAYRDPRALAPYAGSRWAGTPAAMLTLKLRQTLGNVELRTAQCILAVDLEEFSQVFDLESKSRAVLHARASVRQTSEPRRSKSTLVRLERPAPTPNAAGGAAAFSALADEITAKLRDWIAGLGYCQ